MPRREKPAGFSCDFSAWGPGVTQSKNMICLHGSGGPKAITENPLVRFLLSSYGIRDDSISSQASGPKKKLLPRPGRFFFFVGSSSHGLVVN